MIWWIVFIALIALSVAGMSRFVPLEHRLNYSSCHKDNVFWLANISSHAIWIVALIQNVAAPTTLSVWAHIIGIGFIVAGHTLTTWAWRVNNLFIPAIIYVPPRLRVTDGPYRFCPHPGYVGMIWAALGTLLLLGQWWAGYPTIAYVLLIIHRWIAEERILSTQPQ